MTRTLGTLVGLALAGSLILSALIVRNGLLAIASAIRDKPLPRLPEQVHLMAGDSKLNISVGKMSVRPVNDVADIDVAIDNIRIAPTSQPGAYAADPGVGILGEAHLSFSTTQPGK